MMLDLVCLLLKVTGVGEQNSLNLILGPELDGKPVRYRVFISEAGTTTSKVFFDVDPAYPGQHTFFLHGIHYVQVKRASKMPTELKPSKCSQTFF